MCGLVGVHIKREHGRARLNIHIRMVVETRYFVHYAFFSVRIIFFSTFLVLYFRAFELNQKKVLYNYERRLKLNIFYRESIMDS